MTETEEIAAVQKPRTLVTREAPPVLPSSDHPMTTAEKLPPPAASASVYSGEPLPSEVAEFFQAVVEHVDVEAVRVRVTSSEGEKATAFLPIARFPESEVPFLEPGAPVRVTIIDQHGKRSSRIRVLRPFQWRPHKDAAADYLVEKMKALLGDG